ncbi:UNVERIFIED_CONTAM: ATPase family AAA domain-containing protein 1 [Sesamum calycinum]|uniref:ATPase family AAA domain-containing protein 1 n=1 Tax=Sesamum calycinum TaxID=2727403 RepID=A0AAW2LR05_9LAMI
MKSGRSETKFVQELILYAASAALSCLVLFVGLKHLDPNRDASKKALEHKKEIAKRLGRPLIQTNPYEALGRQCLRSNSKSLVLFINVRISNLMSKWFGDAQKLVTAVFTLAYKLQPAIIFIDEVDSFLGQRKTTDHEALTNMKTEFMALWDGFTTDQHAQVMVLAATNRPSELDEAILRRLPQAFEIGIPDRRERTAIIEGSDILELCKKAAYFPIRDLLNNEKTGRASQEPRPLSQLDLETVIATTRKTNVAASEYSRLSSQTLGWSQHRESDDYQVQDAINELSKLVISQILNIQSVAQDP